MFEHSLISLDKKRPARRRWLSLPIAVGLHLAALATFTLASYWHVEHVADPPESGVIWIEPSPPALPAAMIKKGGATPEQAPKAPSQTPHTEIAQPPRLPDKLPTLDTSSTGVPLADVPLGPGAPEGDPNGDPHGDPRGVPGAPFDSKGPGGGTGDKAPRFDEAIHMTAAVIRPVLLDGPQPRYTETARRAGVQGTVVVEAIIDEQGRVTNASILKALPMGLDQAAVEAVKSWRFKPATLAGRAVKVFYTLTVHFSLQR